MYNKLYRRNIFSDKFLSLNEIGTKEKYFMVPCVVHAFVVQDTLAMLH